MVAALFALAAAEGRAAPCGAGPAQQVAVKAVAERLEITLADGRQVRLAGLAAPDPDHGDPATAAAALAFAKDWLAGREVGLRLLYAKPDRWGRLPVDLLAPPPGEAGAAPVSVAAFLLRSGYARVWPEPDAYACLADLMRAEAEARDKRLGLWRDPYYGVVAAADLDNLRKRDGQFTLVEGTPSRVGEGRSRYYVDFGLHRGFTVVIPKRRAKVFERAGMTIAALAGAKIRVRGALDNRFGLRMEISDPDGIERLGESAKGEAQKP
ncbi:MAG TPA: thermonuclease family protein [Roseiarcus sp.]|nr:thermonuclease family protein [Roseiarcus sp.]